MTNGGLRELLLAAALSARSWRSRSRRIRDRDVQIDPGWQDPAAPCGGLVNGTPEVDPVCRQELVPLVLAPPWPSSSALFMVRPGIPLVDGWSSFWLRPFGVMAPPWRPSQTGDIIFSGQPAMASDPRCRARIDLKLICTREIKSWRPLD
jgi:hypothetical protein